MNGLELNNILNRLRSNNILNRLVEENGRRLGLLGIDYDYSLAGSLDSRGHGSDEGKLPNHPTFSNQSKYSNKKLPGGKWGQDFQGVTFKPTKRMIKEHGKDFYKWYFRNVEPQKRLIFK